MPPVEDKLLILGFEAVHWDNESDVRTFCRSCYDKQFESLRKQYHTVPLFRGEVFAQERCDVCGEKLQGA